MSFAKTSIGVVLTLTLLGSLARGEEPTAAEPPVFSRDIAPIIYDNCATCHRPGGSGPFPLMTYQDVRKRARQIVDVARSGFMPPWLPEPGYGEFAATRRLTPEQIATFSAWVEGGTLGGDPSDAPPVPKWSGGWQLGTPDLILKLDRPYTLRADGEEVFRNFVIPIPVTETHYVRALELHADNPQVVHHAIMRVDETRSSRQQAEKDPDMGFGDMNMGDAQSPENFLLAWTPGHYPDPGSDGYSWTLNPNTDFVLQFHMKPSGKPEALTPEIGLYFADEPPTHRVAQIVLRARVIDIPAGEANHAIEDSYDIPIAVDVLSIYPHAHYLGKQYDCWVELPDGSTEWLIKINDWDFTWQDEYRYLQPVRLPAGSRLHMKIVYDNSADNVRNPFSPPQRVQGGSRSVDEMATMTLQVAPDNLDAMNALHESLVRQDLEKDPADWLAHSNLARTAQRAGRLDEATMHYRETLKLNPTHTTVYNNLAIILEQQGRIDDAIELLTRAVRINPGYANAHRNLARLNQLRGDDRAAAEHYQKALSLEPGNAEAHFNFANLLLERNVLEEAAKHLQTAVRLDPEDPEFRNAMGNVYATGGDLASAEAQYRRALEISPDLAEAHHNLGNVLVQEARLAEAIDHYRRALALQPDLEGTRGDLEAALALRAEIDAAIADATRGVTQTGGRDVGALMNLADTYASAGQIKQALETAQRALDLANGAGAPELAQRIQARMELYEGLNR